MSKKTLVLLMFLFFVPAVTALGIAPGRTTVDFTPGLEKSITFTIVNSEQQNLTLVAAAQGELKDYIFIHEKEIEMDSSDISKDVSYDIRLPQELPPGLHTGEVVIIQLPATIVQTEQTYIGAAVALLTQLHINVPYPGKYADADLNVLGPDETGQVTFTVPVFSRGEFTLTSVKATIEIFNLQNEKLSTVYTNEVLIPGMSTKELIARWDASEFASGPYRAEATVVWDEGTTKVEKEFNIGKKRLILEGIEVNDFKLGEIAKFETLVKNAWSQTIEGAYSEMVVYSADGNVLADFKSPTYDILPGESELMLSFWDTKGVLEGSYDSNLYLIYEQVKTPTALTLDVKEDKINIIGAGYIITSGITEGGISKNLLIILVVVIVVLALANISWFIFLRKKFRKNKFRK